MSKVKDGLKNYPEISFIDNLSVERLQEIYIEFMSKKYEELTGKELHMADAEPARLIAYADCMMLYQIAQYADRAGKLSLLKYSYGDYLDNIGALKGIRRLPGAAAKTKIKFTLSIKRISVTIIPAGTRVTASDGVYFYTLELLEIPAGSMYGEVNAECKEIGVKGNGYKPGDLKVLVDPVPYVDKVENITTSEGGAEIESDENLAERIYLAPSSWSTAGPDDAYKYWVKTFDAGISDVRVDSQVPGEVDICFVLQNGEIPEDALLEEMWNFLKREEIRPLTDKVIVRAPDIHEYEVDFIYYINESDRMRAAAIAEQVQKAAEEYVVWQKERIDRDINPDMLRNLVISAGAKRIEVRAPTFQRITGGSIARMSGDLRVVYGGIEDD